MKRILTILFLALLAVSCQELDRPELDSSNTLSSLKCMVYHNAENLRVYDQIDLLSAGSFNPDLGAIAYSFPKDKYTAEALTRCRLEATIPSTARLVELDSQGAEIKDGIGGMRDFSSGRTTVYFKVVAADGTEKKYQAQIKISK